MLKKVFQGKKVLITGNTGFKGTWLSIWLNELGAEVYGYSLPPPTTPSLYAFTENPIIQTIGDIRDLNSMNKMVKECNPDLIFHLAAQPLVLKSYEDPVETFSVNALGTVNLLEASRNAKNLQALIIITTDKCYTNQEWVWGYRENDALGGNDPYSASKAMAELAAHSYRTSFFKGKVPIATARAGNVIGGGDFSPDRLIPDAMKALIERRPIEVRNPKSVRPWLHVLDPLYGYLLLAKKMMEEGEDFGEAWNFGPMEHEGIPVYKMVQEAIDAWGDGDWIDKSRPDAKPEMNLLKLNWDKAASRLGWKPLLNWKEAIAETVAWTKSYHQGDNLCIKQINEYMNEIHSLTPARSFSH